MAGTVTFTRGGTTITIQAPSYPGRETDQYPKLTTRCWGGGVKHIDLGDGSNAWDDPELFWDLLSDADYSSLKTFIENTAEWGANSFTYTDPDGTDHTNLHYVSGLDEFQEVAYDHWSGTLVLVKDMAT